MRNQPIKGFASDNCSGVHPDVMNAIARINTGHVPAYGGDEYTESAREKFKSLLGNEIDVYFVFNGTAANVLSLDATTQPYNAIICADSSHINSDECGAPERFSGCKLVPVKTKNGKMELTEIKKHIFGFGFEHFVQPKVISITQCTEMGTVYLPDEIQVIADLAHENGMVLHMDGARIANAVVRLGIGLSELTFDCGVDVLSFGGTKNGAMFGEAVIFRNKEYSRDFCYIRKQGLQLASKMRFIAVQFETLLSDDLWLKNAAHANKMADYLYSKVRDIPQLTVLFPVETNFVFATLPKEAIPAIQREVFFYSWGNDGDMVRWVTTFDTTEEDVNRLVSAIKQNLK
ncbi:low specificity L-threonine aldolase [bacterium]|nr:low specificity L-threonine aldolase [bacterium]